MENNLVICYDRQEKKHICIDIKDMFNYHYDEITPDCVMPRLEIVSKVPSMEYGLQIIKFYDLEMTQPQINSEREKEAESIIREFMDKICCIYDHKACRECTYGDVVERAEKFLNKANDWHFTNRNKEHQVIDCPKGEENKLYLLLLNSRDSKEYEFGRKVPVVCYWNEEWCRFERLEHIIGERNVNPNDINAWKEIVLPELKESE